MKIEPVKNKGTALYPTLAACALLSTLQTSCTIAISQQATGGIYTSPVQESREKIEYLKMLRRKLEFQDQSGIKENVGEEAELKKGKARVEAEIKKEEARLEALLKKEKAHPKSKNRRWLDL